MLTTDHQNSRIAGAVRGRLLTAVQWLRAGYAPDAPQGHVALVALCGTAPPGRAH